jgi:uncharacterized membrane protein (Fun14 family)
VIITAGAVVARVATRKDRPQPATETARPAGSSGGLQPANLTSGEPTTPGAGTGTGTGTAEPEPSTADKVLPFVTEGGIAMLLGLMLGMATRAIFKLLAVGLILIFGVILVLSHKGMLSVDWGATGTWIKEFVVNISSDESLGGVVKHKLPSAGGLGLGYLLGLKRS